MKAVQMIGAGQPLELYEIPVPAIGERDILVRVRAAGICHSDVHYRAGRSTVRPLPMTLGHEVAGVVEQIGQQVTSVSVGDRVCLHYNITCGDCYYCSTGNEQFCPKVLMLGHYTSGGYAEYRHYHAEPPIEEIAVLLRTLGWEVRSATPMSTSDTGGWSVCHIQSFLSTSVSVRPKGGGQAIDN